jgi:DNA-binding IclR family transcriptional regulator
MSNSPIIQTDALVNAIETVHRYIWQSLAQTGFSPTLREIAVSTGLMLSRAHQCVQCLEKQGRLVRSGKRFMPPQIVAVVKSAASEAKS